MSRAKGERREERERKEEGNERNEMKRSFILPLTSSTHTVTHVTIGTSVSLSLHPSRPYRPSAINNKSEIASSPLFISYLMPLRRSDKLTRPIGNPVLTSAITKEVKFAAAKKDTANGRQTDKTIHTNRNDFFPNPTQERE